MLCEFFFCVLLKPNVFQADEFEDKSFKKMTGLERSGQSADARGLIETDYNLCFSF